jgi:beta-barrel assembly-enhancing protease
MRVALRIAAALSLCALASCSAALQRQLATALGNADSVRLGEVGWELARTAGGDLLEAAKNLDVAMNGCTLAQREPFELDAIEEYYVGRAVAAEHLATLGSPDLGVDHPVSRYVDRVGQLLAIAAEVYGEANARERWGELPEKSIPNRPWPFGGFHFIVLDRAEPNAFGGPGGAVIITTGLLKQLESEDELAVVLSHEVAHVQRGHGVEVMKAFMCQHAHQEKASSSLKEAVTKAAALGDRLPRGYAIKGASEEVLGELLGSITERAASLYAVGYPRAFELEADRIAVRYMELAGYDPGAMTALFDRLAKANRGEDAYGVTHPPFDKRILVVEPVIASVPSESRPGARDLKVRADRFRAEMAALPRPPATAKR